MDFCIINLILCKNINDILTHFTPDSDTSSRSVCASLQSGQELHCMSCYTVVSMSKNYLLSVVQDQTTYVQYVLEIHCLHIYALRHILLWLDTVIHIISLSVPVNGHKESFGYVQQLWQCPRLIWNTTFTYVIRQVGKGVWKYSVCVAPDQLGISTVWSENFTVCR